MSDYLSEAERLLKSATGWHEAYTETEAARDDLLGDLIDACHLITRHLREAEREATPPSAGEGDEFVTGPGEPTARRTFRATAAPPPTPAQDEAAVEALARVLQPAVDHRRHYGVRSEDGEYVARTALAALDRGAVPGYGPTGARGEA